MGTETPETSKTEYSQRLYVNHMGFGILMDKITRWLHVGKNNHAMSKQVGQERVIFTKYMTTFPNIWGIVQKGCQLHSYPDDFESALQCHANNNDYVPAHFSGGISDMDVVQLTEMICDIVVAAQEQGLSKDDLHVYLSSPDFEKEFMMGTHGFSTDLMHIIRNTAERLMG